MGDYTEDGGEKISREACMVMGDLLSEKTAELNALQIADEMDPEAIHSKVMEVNAIRKIYKECDSGEESKVVD